ncbi:XRE family transcriptional regulator protein [Halorubrum sp. AJ67]|nr:XRE family transcriptional regulator protein [Halorubrum sp. AJ67]
MAQAGNQDLTERLIQFYRNNYREEISTLEQNYPNNQRSLYVDYEDLYQFDQDLAVDLRTKPEQMREYAEEALRLYDLPADVSLGRANVRIENLPDTIQTSDISAHNDQVGKLVAIEGIIRRATEEELKITEAAFECQRCGTMSYIPQSDSDYQEPHECQGCERKGPFRVNIDQSEFTDTQTVWLIENAVNLSSGTAPREIEIVIRDDLAGKAVTGDRVRIIGTLHLDQDASNSQSNPSFTPYLDGMSIEQVERDSSGKSGNQHTSIPDLETYTELATTALSTLPEDAREEETKAKLITPFVEALGWNKYDSMEVRLEYTDSKTTLRPDYALFGPESDIPDVIIEAKQIGTDLEQKEQQLYDYLRVFSAEWGVLTNGEEFYVYRRTSDNYLPEKLTEMKLKDLSQASIVDSLLRSSFYK